MTLPDLTPFDGDRLEPHGDYVATDFVERDFTGQDATDARFLECRFVRCDFDGSSLRRARILESLIADVPPKPKAWMATRCAPFNVTVTVRAK